MGGLRLDTDETGQGKESKSLRLSTVELGRISITMKDLKAKSKIILHVLIDNAPSSSLRDVSSSELLVKTADITRSTVQKALVVLATEPVLGSVRTKLGLVTQAFFGQRDFSKMDIVETLLTSLEMSLQSPIPDSTLYSGISLRELVNKFKQKTLQLLKLLLLEKRVLFYGPKVEPLSSYQYSLISLMPDLLRHLHDVGAPTLSYETEESPDGTNNLSQDGFQQKIKCLGLPLRIFGQGAFFQPYIPLQQIDVIMAPETKSFLVGTSNSIFLHNKHAAIDAIVNCEKGTIEVIDPVLMSALQLTSADKRFIDGSHLLHVDDPTLNQQIEFEGSDEDIRSRFESYLFSFLISAKLTLSPTETSPVSGELPPPKSKDYLVDFGSTWVKLWQKTNNFNVWNAQTNTNDMNNIGIGPGHVKEVPSTMSLMSAQLQQFSWSSVIPPQSVHKAINSAAATADTVKSAVVSATESQQAKNSASHMLASMSGWMRKREWSAASGGKSELGMQSQGSIAKPRNQDSSLQNEAEPASPPVSGDEELISRDEAPASVKEEFHEVQNGIEDMVLLSKVTDDQITENLKKRINADLMFTYIGPTLVAVNPYKRLPYFSEKEIDQYHGSAAYEHPPHIYATADKMFQSMITDEENQCVIISGESGAGKTECAKLIMCAISVEITAIDCFYRNYIAAVSPKGGANGNVVENIKQVILESNPLLESFGNAKTLRNNNSSRFGKYFEINFTKSGAPAGGKISNFLLEKSRVVGPGQGERNFHVFYQITTACSREEKEALGMMEPKYFHYLNVSREYSADGINDVEEYAAMKKGMQICNIVGHEQSSIFQLLAGILHLGNISFIEEGNDAKVANADSELLDKCHGVDKDMLNAKLTSRIVTTGGFGGKRSSTYNVTMNVEQATNTRDALAKAIYSRMFDWIVQGVNNALASLSRGIGAQSLCIGVLDIFGFEIFDKNGFEQFCINYVNERLQQIFIELTLKSEQEEYQREGIQWTPIDFFNNKVVVDLIESKRPPGVMAVLDDICSTMHAQVEGADVKFVQKLDMACSQNKHFKGQQNHFIISHYAGSVTYDCDGFTEANKDTLFKDLIALMQSTTNPFIRTLFPEVIDELDKKRPTTVSHKIKNQSQELVDTLMRCTPSYVRCIKPNETKRPKDWDNKRVEHQVRYLNLKENIKVRRAGFCYRNFFDKFLRRFAILTKETWPSWHGNALDGIKIIMKSVDMDPKEWQIGKSKVFIKSPESLFLLEEQRDRKFHGYAKVIQRAYRRWKSRKYFLEMRKKAAEVVYNQKERKRFSLNREFVGDYLNFLDNSVLKSLVGKNVKVYFADVVQKYDRKFKPTQREFLISDNAIFLIGLEKEKDGPNKGKMVKVVKRKLSFKEIGAVSLSIKYSVKKTTWQSGGIHEIKFICDNNVKTPAIKHSGKIAEIRVPGGLPKNSQPKPSTIMQRQNQPTRSNYSAGRSNFSHQTQQASYGGQSERSSQVSAGPTAGGFKLPSGNNQGSLTKAPAFSPAAASAASAAAGKKKPPPPIPPAKKLPQCKALYDYNAAEADELSFKAGDIITIVSKEEGWWTGNLRGQKGLFPANYTEMI
ncbi:Unconventional myosin-Ie [Entophlyctis luteolus]|nr:Unconventional myosin-Ie [Entophlyctis luteolus]